VKRFFKLGPVFAACALAAAVVVPGSAGAAPVTGLSYRLTGPGEIQIGTQTFAVPVGGTGIVNATVDDATGEFSGDFQIGSQFIPDFQTDLAGTPITLSLAIEMASTGVQGTVDLATGQVDLTTAVTVTLDIVLLPDTAVGVCTIGPINLALSSAGGSPVNPADPPDSWAFALAQSDFSVPAASCTGPLADAAQGPFNDQLGLPTQSGTSIAMSFESGEPPAGEELPPPPPPAPSAPAPEVGGATAGAGTEAAGGTELPRTGSATPGMAAVGLVLVATGLWLTRANTALRRVRAD